jgi:hypothetical protein
VLIIICACGFAVYFVRKWRGGAAETPILETDETKSYSVP